MRPTTCGRWRSWRSSRRSTGSSPSVAYRSRPSPRRRWRVRSSGTSATTAGCRTPRAGSRNSRCRPGLTQELGRTPTLGELAARLGCDEDDVREAMRCAEGRVPLSLDAPASPVEDCAGPLSGVIGALDSGYEAVEYAQSLRTLLDSLPERELRVVTLRYFGDLTQSQIAERIGCSQMHVSRILRAALDSLRAALLHDGPASTQTIPSGVATAARAEPEPGSAPPVQHAGPPTSSRHVHGYPPGGATSGQSVRPARLRQMTSRGRAGARPRHVPTCRTARVGLLRPPTSMVVTAWPSAGFVPPPAATVRRQEVQPAHRCQAVVGRGLRFPRRHPGAWGRAPPPPAGQPGATEAASRSSTAPRTWAGASSAIPDCLAQSCDHR
jgi:sigma-70-like protein